jgi:hypothetical protein
MNRTTMAVGPLQIGIALLLLGTALTHLTLNFPDLMFIMNGVGYLGFLLARHVQLPLLGGRENLLRWGLIGYTALTLVLWVAFGERSLIGYVNKTNEVALLALLVVESRQQ